MDTRLFEKLLQEQVISEVQLTKIKLQEREPLSVHWDLRTLLYLGIVLLTTGLGVIVYENIDTIGHAVIIALIGIACAACFFYCLKHAQGYRRKKVESPNIWFDYLLLLGCLLLLTFTGYIQYQYNIFGDRWGLAIFFPMIILFITAYYFDHLGVLSLAITNLAAWAGITVTPLQILQQNDFGSERLIYTGIILGAGLVAISFLSVYRDIKAHFDFTYKNFGAHILFISILAGMFYYQDFYLLWFLPLMLLSAFFFRNAVKERSFYFLVITVLYAYIAISYVVIRLLFMTGGDIGVIYLGLIYFIGSGIILIRLLMRYNKMFKKNDSI